MAWYNLMAERGVIEVSMTPAGIADARAAFEAADVEDAFWLAHHAEFLEKYPDQFVAVSDGDVVAMSPDLVELVSLLERRGLGVKDVWVEFMDADPRPLIL